MTTATHAAELDRLLRGVDRTRPLFTGEGVNFRVWAPFAQAVDLAYGRDAEHIEYLPMRSRGDGYWERHVPSARSGDRYGYRLDGGSVLPDPCSLHQPDGVHRLSALFDPSSFPWSADACQQIPRRDLVFYELHIGTLTEGGTFDAAIERLDDLVDLGITAIEIMPVAQFPGERNWGYDGVHLFAAQNSYGGPEGFCRLIDAAHRRGLAVFLDVVLNHFGPEGNYVSRFGPYYSRRYTTPWGPAFNFDDRGSDPVRHFALEAIENWIGDFRLDGLRLDAVHAMFDISPVHILADIKTVADAAAERNGRTATVVVESLMNDVRMIRSPEVGGYGLDAEWNEDFHHAWLAYLIGEQHGKYVDFGSVAELPLVMQETFSLNGRYSSFRGRRWGGSARGLSADRFVVGIQNHDHVGNRALGERSGQLLNFPSQRLSAAFMLVAPYLPLLFMGEEYGEDRPFLFFCSFEDPQLIENVRVGRRRDYDLEGDIPDPQSPSSLEASRLSWNWDDPARRGLRQLYKDLLAARKTHPALAVEDRQAALWPDGPTPQVFIVHRGRQDTERLTIYFNLTDQAVAFERLGWASDRIWLRTEDPLYSGQPLPPDADRFLLPHEAVFVM